MKFMMPLIVAVSSLFGYDSYIDLNFTADPYDLRGQTHFNISAPHVFYQTDGSIVITPEVATYVNSNTDMGISIAKKHKVGSHVIGMNTFYDRSSIQGYTFHHAGTGLYISSDHFEVTANYYHPLTKKVFLVGDLFKPDKIIAPCKWADCEFLMSTKYFKIGTGPIYNFDFNEFALHSRLVIPTEKCQFSIGGILSEGGFTQAFLSLSFSLMKNPSSSSLSTPINRTKKSSISFQGISNLEETSFTQYNNQIERVITLPKNAELTSFYR